MNFKPILCLALVLAGGLLGCSTTKTTLVSKDSNHETIKLPVKFAGYREFYTFVAQHFYGGMPTDADTLFKLAADSTTEIVTLSDEKIPYVYLVTSHYYNGGIYDQIRGAQGNGAYFILRPLATDYATLNTDKGFELVGILAGNSCELTHSNGRPQFVTHWHMSAAESPESIYEWNGKVFEQIK